MRYVPVSKLECGMALGQDIYDFDGRLLLAKHMILNAEYINNLHRLEFPGIYCDDEFTEDIQIKEVLRPQVKHEAIKLVKNLFAVDRENKVPQEDIQRVVINVVEDVLNNSDVMYNMMYLKTFDNYTYYHSVNVSVISAIVGNGLNMNKYELNILTMAAILHDIGKRFFDVEILNAERKLTAEEMEIVKTHPKLGYDYLRKNYDFSSYVCTSVLQHHEFYNGDGYPLKKAGKEIPIYARIIKIADVYDALTSKRPYHKPMSPADAVEYIMSKVGTEFDPDIVEVFLRKVAVYPIGCEVNLSNGEQAVVLENYSDNLLRPRVKLIGSKNVLDLRSDVAARCITIISLVA